ncbi:MAG: hypothetical protein ACO29O_00120 [Chitinophagaceae bacterium]
MSNTTEQIDRINKKLQSLLKEHQHLQKENEKLRTELLRKSKVELELKERVKQLEEQTNLFRAMSGNMDETSKKEFEKQLNHYIREIDRCIAMLGE